MEGLKCGNIAGPAAPQHHRERLLPVEGRNRGSTVAVLGEETPPRDDEEPRKRIRELERSLRKAHVQIDMAKQRSGQLGVAS